MNGLKYPREWEPINQNSRRMRVPGGWVLHTFKVTLVGGTVPSNSEAMVFVADKEGHWILEKE